MFTSMSTISLIKILRVPVVCHSHGFSLLLSPFTAPVFITLGPKYSGAGRAGPSIDLSVQDCIELQPSRTNQKFLYNWSDTVS